MTEKRNPNYESDVIIHDYVKPIYKCREQEPAFCVAACPFDIDIFDFMSKLGRGSFNAAFKPYRNAVCFPEIVSELCPGYCQDACPRKDTDASVEIKTLEKTCLAKTKRKEPRKYTLPKKEGKVAIIGAGPSGCAMAQRMAARKYTVEIFEKSDRIGGHLWDILSPDIFVTDIERQLQVEEYELHLNTEITSLDTLYEQGFDAIYVATGKDGNDFGIFDAAKEVDGNMWYCFSHGDTGVFAGGSLLGRDTMFAIADGLGQAYSLQGWIQTKILDYHILKTSTKTELIGRTWEPKEAIKPTDKGENEIGEEVDIFTEEEIIAETERCLKCQCDGCREFCDLLAFYDKWPFRVKEEIIGTVAEGESLLNAKPAKRYVNTCTECGLCMDICPESIDMRALNNAAKKILHRQGKYPFGFRQYFLKDMEFSNGPFAGVIKNAPKADRSGEEASSKYAFFPGCQMGASEPDMVVNAYEYLLEHEPSTGLFLGCCGIPSEWAGDPEGMGENYERIMEGWEKLGKPTLILACATCKKEFEEYFPEIKTVFLYDLMAEWGVKPKWKPVSYGEAIMARWGVEPESKRGGGKKYSVFDPCSSRGRDDLRASVRKLAEAVDYTLVPLPRQEGQSACCSYGGNNEVANPAFNQFVRDRRVSESNNPYITYCINCRDVFLEEGKECYHLLDILFGNDPNGKKIVTVTEKRKNRAALKERVLKEYWNEETEKMAEPDIKIIVSPELEQKLNKSKMLMEDIAEIINFCERTKRCTYNTEKDTYTGYRKMGYITYWAEYKKTDDEKTFELVNAYSHRIKIELEEIWNGERVENIDM